ncbi:MAG: hypothetical protein Q4F18_15435 [Clostridia bacterium]|nr:hypothetical protein [Clostridia bacterium]
MATGSAIARSEYDLPGGGSLIAGDAAYKPITRTVVIMPADGVQADDAWARRIIAWLTAGRGRLIVRHSPDTYRIAQFDDAPTYGAKIWPLGGIQVKCKMQGLCHASHATGLTAATSGGKASITAAYATALAAPLDVTIAPTSGTITAAEIRTGGKALALGGLTLTAGHVLAYFAGDAHQGEAARLEIDGAACFDRVTAWAQLAAPPGGAIEVTVTGGEASVTATLRGRWPG